MLLLILLLLINLLRLEVASRPLVVAKQLTCELTNTQLVIRRQLFSVV